MQGRVVCRACLATQNQIQLLRLEKRIHPQKGMTLGQYLLDAVHVENHPRAPYRRTHPSGELRCYRRIAHYMRPSGWRRNAIALYRRGCLSALPGHPCRKSAALLAFARHARAQSASSAREAAETKHRADAGDAAAARPSESPSLEKAPADRCCRLRSEEHTSELQSR